MERNWGIEVDPSLLHRALIHRSFAYEAGGIAHNERLEFLGDSVLSIVVAARLFEDHPDHSEADLSRMRAATVSQEPLAYVARRIHLGDFLYLGRGEDIHGGRD
ncbi:MAG: ribonuclease III domain-containing protein, partial [Actinomyces sp.]|nr:ribonuclease III domain-containing protein [Actinomyces sp.]